MSHDALRNQARVYYEGKLRAFGATPAGVDWNSSESQALRFEQLARLWNEDAEASIVDYGCGYGALAPWLAARGHRGSFTGFDVSHEMVEAARASCAQLPRCTFTSDRQHLTPADFAVASGVFNVKGEAQPATWHEYVLATIDDIASRGRRGFAFNALSSYSDHEMRRDDLYYADPLVLFDYCKRRHSRYVALLHDYPLYEFTLLVTCS